MDVVSRATRANDVIVCLSEMEDTVPQCVVRNLYAVRRRGYFWNVFLPDTSLCVSSRCFNSVTRKVYGHDCAVRIGLHREEGRLANAFWPGTSLRPSCSWRRIASAKDSATLRECDDVLHIVEKESAYN